MHYRNVISEIPYDKYTEVFIDEGQVNMFAVMQELMKTDTTVGLMPNIRTSLIMTRTPGRGKRSGGIGGGGYATEAFNVGFARAMMFAVMSMG